MPLTRLKEEYLEQDGVRIGEPLLLPQAIQAIDLASGESLRDAGREFELLRSRLESVPSVREQNRQWRV